MLRHLLISAIRAYQRHLSPRKGFGCAYRLAHGGSGCSGVGLRLVRRHGVIDGWALLRRRLQRCHAAHRQRQSQQTALRLASPYQRGDCDVGCIDCGSSVCDLPCDYTLSQRQKQWAKDNWALLLIAACAVALAVYFTLPLWLG